MTTKKFKRHPVYRHLQIREDGCEFKYLGEVIDIIDHEPREGSVLKAVSVRGVRLSVPKLILETFGPEKPEGRHYAQYKDGNIENINPSNLYWAKSPKLSAKKKLENSGAVSKLLDKDLPLIYIKNKVHGVAKSKLAEEYNVSSASILRAIRRYEKFLKENPNEGKRK